MNITIPAVYKRIFEPIRHKVLSGGRGSAKSETVARYLLICMMSGHERVLCTRELQKSIKDSVHKIIADIIYQHKLPGFEVLTTSIRYPKTNSEFIFEGLRDNIQAIKSIKGITKCWCEEAHYLSKDHLDVLIPTIREDGSELIYTFNRLLQEDPIFVMFCTQKYDDVLFLHTTYRDNPFFPDVLVKERQKCKIEKPNDYPHIWEGEPKNLGGTMFDPDWFEWTENIPTTKEFDYRFIVADTAYKDKELTKSNNKANKMTDPDFHVFMYIGVKKGKVYIIDMIRSQLKAVDVEAWCLPFIVPKLGYGFRYVWIEDKGHGIYLNQALPRIKPKPIPIPDELKLKEIMTRKLDKVERASNSIAMIDRFDKNVIINTAMEESKVKAIREELIFFPNGVHDDTVDCVVDAIKIALGEPDRISDLKQLLGR